MADKPGPQRRREQMQRCKEMLDAYAAKERKRRRRERRAPPAGGKRHAAIAQLANLLEQLRRRKKLN